MVYDARSRDLILRFKHADRTNAAPTFAKWMTRAGQDLVEDADLVVPVPLHRARLLKRRYNQAALLSNGIANLLAVDRQPALLARVRNTPSQGGRSRTAQHIKCIGGLPSAGKIPCHGRRTIGFVDRRCDDHRGDGGCLRQKPDQIRGHSR